MDSTQAARGCRDAFVAAKEDIGGGHKVAVEVVVDICDCMDVGGNGLTEASGDRQEAAGEVNVAQDAKVAGSGQLLEAVEGEGTILDILQVGKDLALAGTVV